MALCPKCQKRKECREICKAVKKEITGRGKTASRKPKTYPVDFSYIEDACQTLNPFQKDVLKTVKNLTPNFTEQLINKLTIHEAINKTLDNKEKVLIQSFIAEYNQEEIARFLDVSQPRVNFLLKRTLKKLKNSIEGL